MRLTLLACAAAAALLGPACGASQPSAPVEARADYDGRLMPPERVTDHIWVMRQPDRLWAAVIGNVTIVEQSDGVILIDSGGSIPDGREVVRAVAGLTSKPIKAVAITHWHNDHPLGVPAILEAFPRAAILATPVTAEFLKSETKVGVGRSDPILDAQRAKRADGTVKQFEAEIAKTSNAPELRAQYALELKWVAMRIKRLMGNYVVPPTKTISDSLVIADPVVPVELRFIGTGNTHGDLIAWLPKQRVVATGDIVVLPTPYGFDVSAKPWLATLDRLRQLPFTTLIPGHGKVQRDRRYLGTLAWSMNDILQHARAAASAGRTKEKALAEYDRSEQRARFAAADPWTRLWLDGYWLDGMFETAFDEAKGIAAPGK
jgi:glyoxylase-like metal-dependent hydrolase (beta-lactamase superfamily II)